MLADSVTLMGFGCFFYSVWETWGWNGVGLTAGPMLFVIGMALAGKAERKA